jgi:predicted Zn-dependent peptidase
MTKILCSILGFIFCLSAFGQETKTAVPAHPKDIQYLPLKYTPPKAAAYRHVLSNGVVGFFVEDHDLPLINVSVLIRTGAYLEPAGKEGLAAAVGSQMRAGGTAHYKAEAFDEEADFLAAELSSSIGPTSGRASANFMAKDADKALDLFFDLLRNPAFQQDQLDLYKGQQLQGIERRNDSTDEIEGREWNRLLRGDKHFTNAFSTQASLSSLTREDLLAFHSRYYHPKNLILSVSGDFKTTDMIAKLERAMDGWSSSGGIIPAPVPKPEYIPVPGVYMVNKADVNQARVLMGHTGIMRGNPDEIAIDLMNDILGGSGFTSRITNRVRTEEGLAYDAGSGYSAGIYYEGQFRAGFQSKSSTAAQAAQIVLEEIARIRQTKVSQDELDTIKNQAIEVFPRIFASASAIADTFASDEYTKRDPQFWETYRDRVRAVTIDDIQRVAREYLHPDKLVILVVGNAEDVAKGNPDKPQDSFQKISGGKIIRIPLPDPLTMKYPK